MDIVSVIVPVFNERATLRACIERLLEVDLGCEREVVAMLQGLLAERMKWMGGDAEPFFDAVQNARLVADAESYASEHPNLDVPSHACPACGENLEFDDIEEKYLHFLKQQ